MQIGRGWGVGGYYSRDLLEEDGQVAARKDRAPQLGRIRGLRQPLCVS